MTEHDEPTGAGSPVGRGAEPAISRLASRADQPAPPAPASTRYIIKGGRRLVGEIAICGAKNAALPMMAAALLTPEECLIDNVPEIDDVQVLSEVLRYLGAECGWVGPNQIRVRAANLISHRAPTDLVKRMRASFLVMGPLLARLGRAASCAPGGDVIGQRPIDVHLTGFAALGARITLEGEIYTARAPRLRGTKIFMDYPSHIGTENLLMVAVLAEGTTILKNASQEPEVVDLALMLTNMGARIAGAGTSTIVVEGVPALHGTSHRAIADRIEAGTFACAAAISGGDVLLRGAIADHLDALVWKLNEMGAVAIEEPAGLRVRRNGPLRAANVQALPYPGFATDIQATIGVALTQAYGTSVIHERVYDNRLLYFNELRKMGVEVEIKGQTAVVTGPQRLHGATVRALDIRSGAALVLAGLVAEGDTEIVDVFHVDRGYENFEAKMRALGAQIERRF